MKTTLTKPKSRLVFGAIPANTECPFLKQCSHDTMICMCGHQGKDHKVEFSCAAARAYDIFSNKE